LGGFILRDKARTQAELYRTYPAPPPHQPVYQQSVPVQTIQAAPPTKSVEQRMNELDELARKGYVNPDEYKARRKAILDGI